MPKPLHRVCDERGDLDHRITRLIAFIEGQGFLALPAVEQSRLRRQLAVMRLYLEVLDERIAAFVADGVHQQNC